MPSWAPSRNIFLPFAEACLQISRKRSTPVTRSGSGVRGFFTGRMRSLRTDFQRGSCCALAAQTIPMPSGVLSVVSCRRLRNSGSCCAARIISGFGVAMWCCVPELMSLKILSIISDRVSESKGTCMIFIRFARASGIWRESCEMG